MTEFEDNLWREVERTYGSELSDAPDPLRQRSRLRVPVLAGTSLGVVGGSVAAVIVLTASSSPAFAVTRHSDGTVSVVIRRMEGIAGANRRLQVLGIRARAVRVSGVCTAAPPQALAQVTVATVRGRRVDWVGAATSRMAQRIRPAQIPSGRTLVIPAVPGGALVRLVHGRAVSGRVPACLPPVVLIRPGSGPAGGRIVICRAGFTEYPRAVVTGAGTNTTGTNTTGTNSAGTNSAGTTRRARTRRARTRRAPTRRAPTHRRRRPLRSRAPTPMQRHRRTRAPRPVRPLKVRRPAANRQRIRRPRGGLSRCRRRCCGIARSLPSAWRHERLRSTGALL